MQRQVVADRQRVLEADDPDTLDALANFASACWNADLIDEAVATEERILEESERINGFDHVDTLQARAALASSYRMASRIEDATALQDQSSPTPSGCSAATIRRRRRAQDARPQLTSRRSRSRRTRAGRR